MVNSRQKGKRGELEIARLLRAEGFEARRGQQYSGANGDPDVIGLPGIHIEVKRTEAFRLWDALAQSKADAKPGELPIVVHRKNDCEWVVVQPLTDWLKIYREAMPVTTVTIATDPTAEPMNVKFKPVVKGKWLNIRQGVIPAADVRPVVRGEWERISAERYVQSAMYFYSCSACGEHVLGEHNFCPNCGADMRGDADGSNR